jgi:hypothetical protein
MQGPSVKGEGPKMKEKLIIDMLIILNWKSQYIRTNIMGNIMISV